MQTAAAHPHYLSMSLCHMECPSKMTMSGLPTQVYPGPPTFEGILEIRKEKSRDAARSRRGKENYEFYELAKMLPLPGAITSQLDKASIIRLTISYLKLRDFSCHGDPPWNRDGPPPIKTVKGGPSRRRNLTNVTTEIFETHQGTHILQSLDGFAFALSNDARFLYISETVSIYLGLSQVEMTGSSVFDYIHHDDHAEIADQMGLVLPHGGPAIPSPGTITEDSGSQPRSLSPPIQERAAIMNPNPARGYGRSFCIRMKSTLTKRGVHVKCSGFRVVHMLAHMRPQFTFSLTRKHPPPLLGLVGMAIALPPPTINELLIDNDMFVTRLSPEFKIIYCEPRISDVMDVSAEDLTGKNLYDYCHAEDLQALRKSHVDLLTKGQVLTEYYRLLNRHGGFIWVQTCATTICNAKNVEDQNIICINYILSGIEYSGCVMDTKQMASTNNSEPDQSDHSENDTGSERADKKEEHDGTTLNLGDGSHGDGRGQKRKSSSQDGPDVSELSAGSPSNPLAMLYQANDEESMNSLYGDDTKYNGDKSRLIDTKNSRRKMERPRKRRRDSGSDDGQTDVDSNGIENMLPSDSTDMVNNHMPASQNGCVAMASSPKDMGAKIRSPIPEDLSVKNSHSGLSLHSGSGLMNGTEEKWPVSSANAGSFNDVTTTTSSVRDLEEVMNKHLPALPADSDVRSGFHGDYTTSQGVLGFAKHKSTIQWIGSGHGPPVHQEGHPATNLLRSLYANRESVIRTNVYTPRPQYYGDVQPSLLTPPGGTEPSPFVTPQAKTPPATYGLLPAYPTNGVSMSTSLTDSYGMTPPASVSPQDKYSYADQCHEAALRSYTGQETSHPVPIKPQAYPLPAHAPPSIYDRSAAQYASYYAQGFSPYTHSSSPAPAHYREGAKTGTW